MHPRGNLLHADATRVGNGQVSLHHCHQARELPVEIVVWRQTQKEPLGSVTVEQHLLEPLAAEPVPELLRLAQLPRRGIEEGEYGLLGWLISRRVALTPQPGVERAELGNADPRTLLP